MSQYAVTNPATGEIVKEYPSASDAEIQTAIDAADQAFSSWRRNPVDERVRFLTRIAELYEERRDEMAVIITREMGKPFTQARGELDIVASIYRYYAERGPALLADEPLEVASGGEALIRKEGLGVLIGIMPWNFPYYQVARFVAPNLLNGNTILLKHAPQCPESALAMEQLFHEAGLPKGAYTNIFASNEQVADIIADPRIQGVSLTGSEKAGSAVAEIASRHLKKVVLELGGSDPFLVLDSAELDLAVEQALVGRFANAGQACNAAKRIIVSENVYDEFVAKFLAAVEAIRIGDPSDSETFMGPMSSETAAQTLAKQVDDAVEQGAQVLVRGGRLEGSGSWYAPTVLAGITPAMRIYAEELFGPVAVLYKTASEDEAVALANDSSYGLGAVIQSTDIERARELAARLESGMVHINKEPGTAAELPFGGIKRSGFGRELGKDGMEEFVNRKLVRLGS